MYTGWEVWCKKEVVVAVLVFDPTLIFMCNYNSKELLHRPLENLTFMGYIYSQNQILSFSGSEVYDVIVTSHENCCCLFWLIWIEGTKKYTKI